MEVKFSQRGYSNCDGSLPEPYVFQLNSVKFNALKVYISGNYKIMKNIYFLSKNWLGCKVG